MHDYIEDRFKDQLAYYDKKATSYRKKYCRLSVALVFLTPLPMFVLSFVHLDWWLTLSFAASSYIGTILSSLMNLFRYHDLWTSYRGTEQQMRREEAHYQTKTDVYANSELTDEGRLSLFVNRCEELMAQERSKWLDRIQQQDLQNKL